jgi:UPF0755 protein
MNRNIKHRSYLPQFLILLSLLVIFLIAFISAVPLIAERTFGSPSSALNSWQRFSYGLVLIFNSSELTTPYNSNGIEQLFIVNAGENAFLISNRLEQAGLISDGRTFRIYLLWTGMDAYIQIGTYRLSPSLSAESIAEMLQSATLTEVLFSILPGWRMEEIAASLPTSGLSISAEEFLTAASTSAIFPSLSPTGMSAEGYLFPDVYLLPRTITADQLISVLIQGFISHLPKNYSDAYHEHGLTLAEGVILASIIEREAVVDDEMPLIASVFFNRLAMGMRLQADPTVQYALGYNYLQGTWWTTPLSASDLLFNSPYNTYIFAGLPPGPISNPGLPALTAVAFPIESHYFYFQARCDNSGLHNFAVTLEQHEENNCP